MPSKTQADVNLWFLYICLQKSDYKTIDFTAVGEAANLNPPAARMRFSRLKKAIESGSISPNASSEKNCASTCVEGKSKQQPKPRPSKSKGVVVKKEEPMEPVNAIGNPAIPDSEMADGPDMMVYYPQEGLVVEDGNASAYEADYWETEDDDDVPLATKRKAMQSGAPRKKRQKQTTAVKYELASNDENIGFLSHKAGKRQFSGYDAPTNVVETVKDDEVMTLDSTPVPECKEEPLSTPRPNSSNPSTTDMPLQPISMVPQYSANTSTSPLTTTTNNNQYTTTSPRGTTMNPVTPNQPIRCGWNFTKGHPITAAEMLNNPFFTGALPPSASGYMRSPGMMTPAGGEAHSAPAWISYRGNSIPEITITDTDPFGMRNPMRPGSTNAVDQVQVAVNEALFGEGPRSVLARFSPEL
ncbi:hypothetical protein AJ79_09715 [Helicocarpus griseus UAMH5409]|uniref:Myb-like DNA-binding domain-containing protein n=1 Tax=Helicocarpus griseus UAMH5409 TaxID=1447875 RepID=A0A2B7WHU8_9EURO|nr:hypothetical protein AJ79_09715 [Helicocarpus griseus UAMH5409]